MLSLVYTFLKNLFFFLFFFFKYLFIIQHFTVTWFTVASMTTPWTTATTTSPKASITTKDLYVPFLPPLTAHEREIIDDRSIYCLSSLSFVLLSGVALAGQLLLKSQTVLCQANGPGGIQSDCDSGQKHSLKA